jgi:FAD/FMN-containing dehydrogenase
MGPLSRRQALAALAVGVPAAALLPPAGHIALSALRDRDAGTIPPPRAGYAEDASRLDEVPVDLRIVPAEGAEDAIGAILAEARRAGQAVAIAGARHTMGGHTSFPHGIVLDTSRLRAMHYDDARAVLTVQSGARWSDVLAYLDPLGRSVAIMQAYSSFSIGGSLGANAHGWQHDRPPLASSVEALRIMLEGGRVVRASRTENAELFSLVMGGYGLFGVVLDVELRTVANVLYSQQRWSVDADGYVAAFEEHVRADPQAGLAYGRISVAPGSFLRAALLTSYRADAAPGTEVPPLRDAKSSRLARAIFRGSVGSDYGKRLRWQLESAFGGEAGDRVSRNQVLDEPVSLFDNHDPARTDILQEYYVPQAAFAAFLARVREIVPRHRVDLLNVTVRNVFGDRDAFLRYADGPMFALVFLFTAARTPEEDARLAGVARELIDAVLPLGGRQYLPYRLNATPEQLVRGYPRIREFFAAKRRWDPGLLFRNHWFAKYADAV